MQQVFHFFVQWLNAGPEELGKGAGQGGHAPPPKSPQKSVQFFPPLDVISNIQNIHIRIVQLVYMLKTLWKYFAIQWNIWYKKEAF